MDWISAALIDPKEGPYHEALTAAQREVILDRVKILVWISCFVMPTTCLGYVAVVAPSSLPLGTAIIAGAVAAVLIHLAIVRAGLYDRLYHLAMLVLVGGVFGPTGAAIIEITREGSGSFLFAYFLIYFAFTALFPADAKWVLITCVTLILAYVGVRLGRPEGIVLEAELVTDLIYLAQLSFIGLVLNRVVVNLFFAERRSALELSAANQELKALDRAKTDFFSNVSHELRTPLTLVLTPLRLLLERDDLPAEVVERLRAALVSGNRLLKMVNQLLDFARVEAGQAVVSPRRLSLSDLMATVSDLFDATASELGLALEVDEVDPELRVVQDLDKVEQILVNLVGNALKFTPRDGRVAVRCRVDGAWFELEVDDTGPGIPATKQGTVFDRFVQVEGGPRAAVRGTGIGLSMVREYARLLGGEVSLRSVEGKGSCFVVRLPVELEGAQVQATPSRRTRAQEAELAAADLIVDRQEDSRTLTNAADPDAPWVMVVDDNPGVVALVRSILEERFNLRLAYDAEEGLRVLDSGARVDLVISDVMMPGMSGLEFCRVIKANARTRLLPVILLTARGAVEGKVEGLEHGADDYIGKPFDPNELRARVDQLFELRRITASIEQKNVELAAAHDKLKSEELKLISSEKLRTMGDLAAGIFHELHNYLNMIHNGATPLKELVHIVATEGGTPEDVAESQELAGLILEAADHARGLTRELKGYAHHDANLHRVVDLHEVLRSNLRMFGKIPRSLEVVLDFEDGEVPLSCAPTHLVQVFTNLVKNAFEAMDQTGTVLIRTSRQGEMVEVRVIDDGPGVDPAFAHKLFEPFQSTKEEGRGLGLGLSLARKVVEKEGATLEHDASHEGGACFVVRLPMAKAGGARPTPLMAATPASV